MRRTAGLLLHQHATSLAQLVLQAESAGTVETIHGWFAQCAIASHKSANVIRVVAIRELLTVKVDGPLNYCGVMTVTTASLEAINTIGGRAHSSVST